MKFLSAMLVTAFCMVGAVRAADVDTSDPKRLVETTAQAILNDLNAHRAEYRKDPAKVQALVERLLLPYFDTQFAAQQVLKGHAANITPEQRQRFIDAFYKSMLRKYGNALVDFTSERMKIGRVANLSANRAMVYTQVKRDNGASVDVNYDLRKTASGWKAWNVNVEGISYVTSFREDIGSQIDGQGIEAVITRLEKEGASTPSVKK